MKIILSLFLLYSFCSFGQESEIWNSYYDNETQLTGYKNAQDSIVIKAKFGLGSVANKFDKIIAVTEYKEKEDIYDSYYLLKNGTKFGRDSLYVFDFLNACESEGFIVFEDRKNDLVGFFNSRGKVAIPAQYNAVSPVRNGVFRALKNAEKKYWESEGHSGCNHWSWNGGEDLLVDINNNILINDFKFKRGLNHYSLKVTDEPLDSNIRDNYIGVNGKYYSFVNNIKAFNVFFEDVLINLDKEQLSRICFNQIAIQGENGWTNHSKEEFIQQYGAKVINKLKLLKDKTAHIEYYSDTDDLSSIPNELANIYENKKDNCGQLIADKYPIIIVVVNHKSKKDKFLKQDHYHFIKVNKEYQLIRL